MHGEPTQQCKGQPIRACSLFVLLGVVMLCESSRRKRVDGLPFARMLSCEHATCQHANLAKHATCKYVAACSDATCKQASTSMPACQHARMPHACMSKMQHATMPTCHQLTCKHPVCKHVACTHASMQACSTPTYQHARMPPCYRAEMPAV